MIFAVRLLATSLQGWWRLLLLLQQGRGRVCSIDRRGSTRLTEPDRARRLSRATQPPPSRRSFSLTFFPTLRFYYCSFFFSCSASSVFLQRSWWWQEARQLGLDLDWFHPTSTPEWFIRVILHPICPDDYSHENVLFVFNFDTGVNHLNLNIEWKKKGTTCSM